MANVATVIVTAFLAVLVFVVTQSFLKLVLESIQEQRKLIGEVAHALLFYRNVYRRDKTNPPGEEEEQELAEARKALRELAGRLRASLWTIPFYDVLARWGRVPRKLDVLAASDALLDWSVGVYGGTDEYRTKNQEIISDRLGISKTLKLG